MKRKNLKGQYLEVIATMKLLRDYLLEAHDDEIRKNHYGDGRAGCSYCDAIEKARALARRIKR